MNAAFIGDIIYYTIFFGIGFMFWYVLIQFWKSWKELHWQKWFRGIEYTMLEIKVPAELQRTALAMEYVLNALWEPSGGGGWFEDWLGIVTRPIHSLELVSIGGTPHFYIWTPKNYKTRFETHLYGQYPTIQVVEVPDYTRFHEYHPDTHKLFGFEYRKVGPQPLPILTYKHMGQDKTSAEEYEKYNTLSQYLEVMSAIGPHENMWLQLVIRTHREGESVPTSFFKRLSNVFEEQNPFLIFRKDTVNLNKQAEELLEKRYDKNVNDKSDEKQMQRPITKADEQYAEILRENATKPFYDVGIRQIYFAPNAYFNAASHVHNMGSVFKVNQGNVLYNNLVPGLVPSLDKPWQFARKSVVQEIKDDLHATYLNRDFFNYQKYYKYGRVGGNTLSMTTEELATIYHLPGAVAQAPTFERINASTAEAPSNLPI